MGERKVINKYYPSDFDPSKLPRSKKAKNSQQKVRVMLPMTICCTTCGEYIYKGKKFNARKETVEGEDYLGIRIYRFYIKCTRCSSEITFKTDPRNSDYTAEFGATRNFEPWHENDAANELSEQVQQAEEADAMKALESRTLDSKREMDILDALDELRALSARVVLVDTDSMLEQLHAEAEAEAQADAERLLPEDEALLKSVVFEHSKDFVRRVDEKQERQRIKALKRQLEPTIKPTTTTTTLDQHESNGAVVKRQKRAPLVPGLKIVKHTGTATKPDEEEEEANGTITKTPTTTTRAPAAAPAAPAAAASKPAPAAAALNLLAAYGSDDDDE